VKLTAIFARGSKKSAANRNLTAENAAFVITRWAK
jgi:hypothetical protein